MTTERSQKVGAVFLVVCCVATFGSLLAGDKPAATVDPVNGASSLEAPGASSPVKGADNMGVLHLPGDGWDEEELSPPPSGPHPVRRVVLSVSVEHWVFGQEGVHGNQLLDSFLQQKLVAVQREYQDLAEHHLDKLSLAGRGDIKRFHDQVAQLKSKYPQNTIAQDQLQQVLAEVQTLRQKLRPDQLFGNESLFTKTLRVVVARERRKDKQALGTGTLRLNESQFSNELPADSSEPVALQLTELRPTRVLSSLQSKRISSGAARTKSPPPAAAKTPSEPIRDDEYYRQLVKMIVTCFDPETPFREEQREPLIALLRKVSQRDSQIPINDSKLALQRLQQISEHEFLTVLDQEQFQALRRCCDAAK